MARSLSVRTAVAAVTLLAAGLTAGLALPADASVHRSGQHHPHPAAARDYLALGDSVSFGYREPANLPTPDYADAASFVGFPEDIAANLGLHVANASCPGETSASLIDNTKPSYACETDASGTGPGYRTAYPLHEKYTGSQLAYGLHYLRHHHGTRLVTLMIGANDGFLCQATTSDKCASELPAVLAKVKKNVSTILKAVRSVYRGPIVIVNYYSTDYTSPVQVASSKGLNAAMDAGAKPYHVRIADGYAAFQHAAEQAGGDTCKAGLLTTLTTGGCGVHPSVAGQQVLAGTVESALARH